MKDEKIALAARELSFGGPNGDYVVSVARLSDDVRFALMQRTFAHIMGNEASAVRARHEAMKDEAGALKYDATELAVIVHDWRVAKIAALEKGEFSLRQTGPKLTSDERTLREIARDAIIDQSRKVNRAMPKASDKDAWDTAIDRYLATPRLRAVADKELARRKEFIAPEADVEDLFA